MRQKTYRAARLRAASYDEKANTVEVTWSTGADVLREDWDGPYIERLLMGIDNVRLDRLNAGAPLLDTHQSDRLSNVIGSVVPGSAKIENGRGIATIKLSNSAADADAVGKIRDGVIRNISVGYWTHATQRSEGSKGDPPVVTITDWEPLEISAVPIPADPGAQIRSANGKRASKPLSREQRDFAAGAAEAGRLLGRRAPAPIGPYRAKETYLVSRSKPTELDKRELERGARAARRLLKRQ